jgi:hypothetical protein
VWTKVGAEEVQDELKSKQFFDEKGMVENEWRIGAQGRSVIKLFTAVICDCS